MVNKHFDLFNRVGCSMRNIEKQVNMRFKAHPHNQLGYTVSGTCFFQKILKFKNVPRTCRGWGYVENIYSTHCV